MVSKDRLRFLCECRWRIIFVISEARVPRSELPSCATADKVMHFSMTSHHEIFDSAASSGMLGHLGGGTPQGAPCRQSFRTLLPLCTAPVKPFLDPSNPFIAEFCRTVHIDVFILVPLSLHSTEIELIHGKLRQQHKRVCKLDT